jgi:hypothetical protein
MSARLPGPGGFLPDALPSPVSTSHSAPSISLPHPRSQPLRAGSSKEEAARRYMESRLLYVSRRYTKKFQPPKAGDEVVGYRNICDVCDDLSEIVDVLWLSGTRRRSPDRSPERPLVFLMTDTLRTQQVCKFLIS